MRVVAGVLVESPAKGQPDKQIAVKEPKHVAGPARDEDLLVSGVVAQER